MRTPLSFSLLYLVLQVLYSVSKTSSRPASMPRLLIQHFWNEVYFGDEPANRHFHLRHQSLTPITSASKDMLHGSSRPPGSSGLQRGNVLL